ncbi:MAG: PhzF family phenazine biosynthesis protein [Pseudomonadales bacterium]
MNIYQVFYTDSGAQGNFAAISAATGAREEQLPLLKHEQKIPETIAHCHISSDDNNRFKVDCFQEGRKIQCCGHGLLASAYALFQLTDHKQINLGEGITAERLATGLGSSEIWLFLPSIEASSIDIPNWTSQLLSTECSTYLTPLNAASTSPDDGYLLLQLDNQFDLDRLEVSTRVISTHTQRAVLAWQRCTKDESLIKVRYFAPQYGNDEDTATGSVLRVLGPYLNSIAGLESFTVFQCSESGGRMRVRNLGNRVAIGGNVRSIEVKEFPAQWKMQN